MIRCAFFERDVTPPLGSDIPGYWKKRPATGVLDPLYVKAFVADDGERRTALIAADAVELLTHQCEKIAQRVEALTGIGTDSVAVTATHTHYGVPCGEPYGAEEDAAFMDVFCRVAADCVLQAVRRLAPCEVRFGCGRVDGISFNRDYVLRDGSVCTNPGARDDVVRPFDGNDPLLPVLSVRDAQGRPVGAVISFACHQDCIGGSEYSGDFSSELSRQLKSRYGEDFVSVYVAGASGDINHIDRSRAEKLPYTERGRRLAAEAARVIETDSAPGDTDRVFGAKARLLCRLRRATAAELAEAQRIAETGESGQNTMLGSLMSELLLDYEKKTAASGRKTGELPVQVFSIGGIFLAALPGELYHRFGTQIREAAPGGRCVIATLSNGMYGYIPVPELLGTDVYPAQLCAGSRWEGDTGDRIVRKTAELMRMLGR